MYHSPIINSSTQTKKWFNGVLPASLNASSNKDAFIKIMDAALNSVDPSQTVLKHVFRDGNLISIQDQTYNLDHYKGIFLVSLGKAALPMTEAILQILQDRLTGGIILVKEGYISDIRRGQLPDNISIIEAGHPLPDKRGIDGSRRIATLLENVDERDLVICLISGGGSALMTDPASDISLEDMQLLTTQLLNCGASIDEINTIRKHIERLKGGWLARIAAPSRIVSLILSDVVGNPLEVIASGPTVPDPTTYKDVIAILQRYKLFQSVPKRIHTHLLEGLNGDIPDTPKPGEAIFDRVYNFIIGSNQLSCRAAIQEAKKFGFNTLLLTTYLQGEARQAGRFISALAKELVYNDQPIPKPACIILGGETTVTVNGMGLGGRNLEIALGAVNDFASLDNTTLITLTTDGVDGLTDAAGAVVTGETLYHAMEKGLDPQNYLDQNDSYHFFEQLGDLIKIGPTGTNVNDLAFLFSV
jgi:glycerate 2-kinase